MDVYLIIIQNYIQHINTNYVYNIKMLILLNYLYINYIERVDGIIVFDFFNYNLMKTVKI